MLSVVSFAVKTGEPVVDDLTVKVTTPELLELPDAAEIVSVAPRLDVSVTVFPDTPLPFASFKVTVMVDVLLPSADTEVGDALTVDVPALTAPAVSVITEIDAPTDVPTDTPFIVAVTVAVPVPTEVGAVQVAV